jgi:hypothetical protein
LLYFGRVSAILEEFPMGDAEVGIRIGDNGDRRSSPEASAPPPATVILAPVERFTLDELPRILRKAVETTEPGDVARAAGKALLSALGCRSVQVTRITKGLEGVLFDGGTIGDVTGATIDEAVFTGRGERRVADRVERHATNQASCRGEQRSPSRAGPIIDRRWRERTVPGCRPRRTERGLGADHG